MGLLTCTGASLSQDEFHRRGLWVTDITYYGVAPPPFLTSKELSSREDFLDFENEKYAVSYPLSGWGPASSLDSLAIDILEFLSTENEIKLLTLRGSIYLWPQNEA